MTFLYRWLIHIAIAMLSISCTSQRTPLSDISPLASDQICTCNFGLDHMDVYALKLPFDATALKAYPVYHDELKKMNWQRIEMLRGKPREQLVAFFGTMKSLDNGECAGYINEIIEAEATQQLYIAAYFDAVDKGYWYYEDTFLINPATNRLYVLWASPDDPFPITLPIWR